MYLATVSHPFSVVPCYSSGGGDTRSRGRIWTPTVTRTTITVTRIHDIVQMTTNVYQPSYLEHRHLYRLQTKFTKVMFLHLSVILSMGGVNPSACWDTHPPGRHPPGQITTLGRHPRADTPPRQITTLGGHPPGRHTPRADILGYGQQAGGTPPTEMHFCVQYVYHFLRLIIQEWNLHELDDRP